MGRLNQQIQPIQDKKRNLITAAASFLLPVTALLMAYAVCGIMPFGKKSILTGDLTVQYSAFLVYLRELIRGNVPAFYTFSKVLGGDMAGFLSYYCLSPFNIIMLLFKDTGIQEAVLLLTLLKTGCAGAGMYFYLKGKRYCGYGTLLFSTAYSLMAYNTAYQNNIMWLDGLVFLPFIIMGLERLLKTGRTFAKGGSIYIGTLALLLLTNYYIGYMLCIFAVLYAFYYIFFDGDTLAFTAGERWKACRAFAASSLLAGGLAAAVLMPTVYSLRGGKAEFDIRDLLDFSLLYTPGQVVSELFIGNALVKEDFNTLPNIYCGLLVILFAILFFAAHNIALREKLGNLILIIIIGLSFLVAAFDRIWHGTAVPAGSPHRYSFLFSFLLILTAYKGYYTWRKGRMQTKQILYGIIVYALFLVWYVITRKTADMTVMVNIVAAAAFGSCVMLRGGSREKRSYKHPVIRKTAKYVPVLLAAGLAAELIYSGACSFWKNGYDEYPQFKEKLYHSEKYVQDVKQLDSGWYRMEQSGTNVTMNDAMLYRYNGLWSYSSCEKEATKRLAGKFGLNDRTWWVTYHNEVPSAAESVLGLKYVISSEPVQQGRYEILKEYGGGTVLYHNPNALALGFLVEPGTADVNMDSWDVLWIQNELWKRMTGKEQDIYRYADRDEVLCERDRIVYSLTVEEEYPIYTCFRDYGSVSEMTVELNGKEIRRFSPEMQAYCMGNFRQGDELTICISSEEKDISWYDLYFYYEDMDCLRGYAALLQGQSLELAAFRADRLAGKIFNPADTEKRLLLTVPADRGWTVLVDGVKAPVTPAAGGLISVAVLPGEHFVEAQFVPEGLWMGISISAACLCICVLMACRHALGWSTKRENEN